MLVEHFHLTLAQIGELTDRQILEIYFHERDPETGAILDPTQSKRAPSGQERPEPKTYDEAVASLYQAAAQFRLSDKNVQEAIKALQVKWGISPK